MDEEDGRPGPGARQFGTSDVVADASVGSVCLGNPQTNQTLSTLRLNGRENRTPCLWEAEGGQFHGGWPGGTK